MREPFHFFSSFSFFLFRFHWASEQSEVRYRRCSVQLIVNKKRCVEIFLKNMIIQIILQPSSLGGSYTLDIFRKVQPLS